MRLRQKRYCEMCVIGELIGGIRRRFCSKRCKDWHGLVMIGQLTMERARQALRLKPGEIMEMASKHKKSLVEQPLKDPKKVIQGRKGGLKLAISRGPDYYRAIQALRKTKSGGRPDIALAFQKDAPRPLPRNLTKKAIAEMNSAAA